MGEATKFDPSHLGTLDIFANTRGSIHNGVGTTLKVESFVRRIFCNFAKVFGRS